MRPNLFKFATSELSQDAFLCWLISWADPKYKATDEALHGLGQEFLKRLFQKVEKQLPIINKLEILQQNHNMDVAAKINEDYFLLIEDKVHTGKHSEQLGRYYNKAKEDFPEDRIIPIFLKTMYQSHYETENYALFDLDDMINVLAIRKDIENPILQDFLGLLTERKNKTEEYNKLEVEHWNLGWVGIFRKIQQYFEQKDYTVKWKKIAAKDGSFWGLWMHRITPEIHADKIDNLHLLLRQKKGEVALEFKIKVKNKEDRKAMKRFWRDEFIRLGQSNDIPIGKVDRMGDGDNMSVACYKETIIRKNENGVVDFEHLFNAIATCTTVLNQLQ